MSRSRRLRAETIKTLAFGSIAAGFTAIGTAFSNPVSKMYLTNLTDANLSFSHDGVNTHFILPKEGMLVYDISYDSLETTFFSQGESLYVKQLQVPSAGSVYLTVYYIED